MLAVKRVKPTFTLILGSLGMFSSLCIFTVMAYKDMFLQSIAILVFYRGANMLLAPAYQTLSSNINANNLGKLLLWKVWVCFVGIISPL